eukprot:3834774-Prymnesium_polylepis.1
MTGAGEIADCSRMQNVVPAREISRDAARMQNAECECGCQGVMGATERIIQNAEFKVKPRGSGSAPQK